MCIMPVRKDEGVIREEVGCKMRGMALRRIATQRVASCSGVSFGVDACVSGVRPRNVKHTAIASLTSCGSFFIFQPEHRLVIEHRSTHL